MPDRLEQTPIVSRPAAEEPRCPYALVAGVVGGDPVVGLIVGRVAEVVEFDADEEATGGDGVDLVVDAMLGAEGREATGPVGCYGVGGESGRGKSEWRCVVVVGC